MARADFHAVQIATHAWTVDVAEPSYDGVRIVTIDERLGRGLVAVSSMALAVALPALAVLAQLLAGRAPFLVLAMVVFVAGLGVAGSVLGRSPRLPAVEGWVWFLAAAVAAGQIAGVSPAGLVGESARRVGGAAVLLLAAATIIGFEAARAHGLGSTLARLAPTAAALTVVATAVPFVSDTAIVARSSEAVNVPIWVNPMVLLSLGLALMVWRLGARLWIAAGVQEHPWTVAAVVATVPGIILGILPAAVAAGPFLLAGSVLGDASAARRRERRKRGGRRTKHWLAETDARAFAVVSVLAGAAIGVLAVLA